MTCGGTCVNASHLAKCQVKEIMGKIKQEKKKKRKKKGKEKRMRLNSLDK